MLVNILTLSACIIAIIAYGMYYFNIKKSKQIHSRYSWIIWSVSISLETITYWQVSDDRMKSLFFIISSICCILITVKIWTSSNWCGPNKAEKYSLLFYGLFLIVWPFIQIPFIAHLLLLIAIPITFIPTFKSSYSNFKNEKSIAWLLWSVSDFMVIIVIGLRIKTMEELPYAIIEFACHFSVVAIVFFQRLRSYNKIVTHKHQVHEWVSSKRVVSI